MKVFYTSNRKICFFIVSTLLLVLFSNDAKAGGGTGAGGQSGNSGNGSNIEKNNYLIASPNTFKIGDIWSVSQNVPTIPCICEGGLLYSYSIGYKKIFILNDQLRRGTRYRITGQVQYNTAAYQKCLNLHAYIKYIYEPVSFGIINKKRIRYSGGAMGD